jgi:hypothetical protein
MNEDDADFGATIRGKSDAQNSEELAKESAVNIGLVLCSRREEWKVLPMGREEEVGGGMYGDLVEQRRGE